MINHPALFTLILAFSYLQVQSLQVNCTQKVILTIGSEAVISCSFQTEYPIRKYIWRKNGSLLLSLERGKIEGDRFGSYDIFLNGSLKIKRASKKIEGEYEFRLITETTLESESDSMLIYVIESPTQKSPPIIKSSTTMIPQESKTSSTLVIAAVITVAVIIFIVLVVYIVCRRSGYLLVSIGENARIQILAELRQGDCLDDCDGQWLTEAENILHTNTILPKAFSTAVYYALQNKQTNFVITGKDNCGKTFLLTPLRKIYKCFPRPQPSHENLEFLDATLWDGADEADLILLDDFNLYKSNIDWEILLKLFKGQPTELKLSGFSTLNPPCQKVIIPRDTPVFCTAQKLMWPDKKDDPDAFRYKSKMVTKYCKHIKFDEEVEIPRIIPACPHCFSVLIFKNLGRKKCKCV